jgi:hypothetical protein
MQGVLLRILRSSGYFCSGSRVQSSSGRSRVDIPVARVGVEERLIGRREDTHPRVTEPGHPATTSAILTF